MTTISPHLPLVRSGRVAAIDQATIQAGTLGRELMERAGKGVWDAAVQELGLLQGSRVVFLCGKGNNGGDGFVAARHARDQGWDPVVVLLASREDVRGDARYHLNAAENAGVSLTHDLADFVQNADAVFDGLVGTGVSGSPRPPLDVGIEALERAACPVVAIDLPSGMDGDSGLGTTIKARLTVTFSLLKPCHVTFPGRAHCGRTVVVDIGLSAKAVARERIALVSYGRADPELPERVQTAHKGDAGRATIVAGAVGMTGAACLAAESTLRSGAGLVTLALPETLNDIAEVKLTEVMSVPLPEVGKHRCLSIRARDKLRRTFAGSDAIAVGPGLGRHRETVELVKRLMRDLTAPTVIDADGLNAFSGEPERIESASQPVVITPHPGEFVRLTGTTIDEPITSATGLARLTGATVVLKGAPTVVATSDGHTFVNLSGNPGMATGGSGDVLTGLITGLLAQGMSPDEAAIAGVYWHGVAGDIGAAEVGERGMIAGDILNRIPLAEQEISGSRAHDRYLSYVSR